ncbi:MAG: sugar transferase [Minisyncoccia bacterium]
MAFDSRETTILLVGDFFILMASLWIALLIRNLSIPSYGYFASNAVPFLPMFLLSLVVFYVAGLYEKQTRPIRRVMGVRILGAQAATVAITAILFFVLPLSIAPKVILMLYLAVSVVAESVWRFNRMTYEMKANNRVSALLIGSGPAADELFDEVNGNDRFLIRFVQHIETDDLTEGRMVAAIASGIAEGARIVVVDALHPVIARSASKFNELMTSDVTFRDFEALYEEIFDRVPLKHLDPIQLLESLPRRRGFYDTIKRLFDILLVLVACVIAVPLVAISVLLLLMTGGRPFIFNERIGKSGRHFRIVKLRTMLLNDHGDPELQKRNRVTVLGAVLRRTRIDELPQLWNVLAGDLSFIGPRPELPKIAEVYEREIPQYRMRYLIAPGLSGWAQIHDADAPRGPADVLRTKRKLSFDLYYLKHRSAGLDLAIAFKTFRTLLSFSGT